MYLAHYEGKAVVAKKFIRTLQKKIYKHITTVSKNVYIDKLDDIVNKYNNTCHRTKIIHILTLLKKLMIKILNFKLLIMLEYQNTKTFLLQDILRIGRKKIL